jgi:hypothetical protein
MQVWDHEVHKYPYSMREDSTQQEDAAATRAEDQKLGVDELVLQVGDDADEVQQPMIQAMKTSLGLQEVAEKERRGRRVRLWTMTCRDWATPDEAGIEGNGWQLECWCCDDYDYDYGRWEKRREAGDIRFWVSAG